MVFTDHRYELPSPALWREYDTISLAADNWRSLIDHYQINTVVASAQEQAPLIDALSREPAWRRIPIDHPDTALFMRVADSP
jgi:hypothetical protein